MALNPAQVEAVFSQALGKVDPVERSAYLEGACGLDNELRQRVDALLRSHEQAGSFLGAEVAAVPTLESMPMRDEQPGTIIGHYKLLQRIGEGGFGVVFMAE